MPSPALTKALLVNTATDLAGGDNGKGAVIAGGPNTDQGWGRVNLGSTFDSTAREFRDQLSVDVLTAPGQSVLRAYRVQDASKPVKVTLAWTDAPGPTTRHRLREQPRPRGRRGRPDLQGQRVRRRLLAHAAATADTRNNVESVYLPAGTAGRFVGDGHGPPRSPATACPATATRPTRTSRSSSRTPTSSRRRCSHTKSTSISDPGPGRRRRLGARVRRGVRPRASRAQRGQRRRPPGLSGTLGARARPDRHPAAARPIPTWRAGATAANADSVRGRSGQRFDLRRRRAGHARRSPRRPGPS